MFNFQGSMSFQDYLLMVRRLSYRTIFIVIIAGLVIARVFFTIFKWNEIILFFLVVLYLSSIAFNYFVVVPYNSKKKYMNNESLRGLRKFSFSPGQKLEIPIYRISFYDDVIYITTYNRQAMMVRQNWISEPEKWGEFMDYAREELCQQIVPKNSRR